jgi:acetoin utilization deacetylase AcuC-like enzyme
MDPHFDEPMKSPDDGAWGSPGAAPIGLVDDAAFDLHRAKDAHPERPERLEAARRGVLRADVETVLVPARPADLETLGRVHRADYLDDLERAAGERSMLDDDTYIGPKTFEVARRAAGGVVALMDEMLAGRLARGFALVRPPGHHAGAARAMGFCVINNVAVAAAHVRARTGRRVAIVDWDVHHGNGTQEIFWRDPGVLFVSLHQRPLYPDTGAVSEVGEDEGRGYTINVALGAGAGPGEYLTAFERIIVPALDDFEPWMVLVSAGYDAYDGDPLADMRLSADTFGTMTQILLGVAERHARGRIALVLEGGYDLDGLERGVASSMRALSGTKVPVPALVAPRPAYAEAIEAARRAAAERWTSCR